MIRTSHFLDDAAVWLENALVQLRQQHPEVASHTPACRQEWNRMLCDANLVSLTWPQDQGGRALSTATLIAFHEMCARHRAPQPINSIAHAILAPTLLMFGTQAQKKRFLPGIRTGEDIWCQGYSEPCTGSDLSSVRTRAVRQSNGREKEHWLLNGHKIWTTQGHLAKWCFALVRTDPTAVAHHGLSFMLVDMQAPGVRVEPIKQLTGESDYAEVFFENVEVPQDHIVGTEGDGWRIAMAAAEHERGVYFLPRVVLLEHEMAQLKSELAIAPLALAERHVLEHRLQHLVDQCQVVRWRVNKVLEAVAMGETPGIEGAMLKLLWSETRQQVQEFRLELLGESALLSPQEIGNHSDAACVIREFLWSRAETIVAGTSEIQRNIVAERKLGLPKDRGAHVK